MKQIKFPFLLTALLCMVGARALAYDAKIDGIYYNFSGTEATVTYYKSYYGDNKNAYTGSVTIPTSVTYNGKTYSVTSIGKNAFTNCPILMSVTIPNSVTTIGEGAFKNCSGLQKVIVKDIAAWCGIVFYGTIVYSSTYYFSNPLYYAHHLYSDENTEITNLVIPDDVTSIGDRAFYGCSGLTSVTIPNSVTSIGVSAFYGCSGLTSVTIPNSVTSIGKYSHEIKDEANMGTTPISA